jgi:hypothetical protein
VEALDIPARLLQQLRRRRLHSIYRSLSGIMEEEEEETLFVRLRCTLLTKCTVSHSRPVSDKSLGAECTEATRYGTWED